MLLCRGICLFDFLICEPLLEERNRRVEQDRLSRGDRPFLWGGVPPAGEHKHAEGIEPRRVYVRRRWASACKRVAPPLQRLSIPADAQPRDPLRGGLSHYGPSLAGRSAAEHPIRDADAWGDILLCCRLTI